VVIPLGGLKFTVSGAQPVVLLAVICPSTKSVTNNNIKLKYIFFATKENIVFVLPKIAIILFLKLNLKIIRLKNIFFELLLLLLYYLKMKLNTLLFIFLLSTQNVFTQNRTSLECLNREFHVVVHIITDSLFNPAALPVNAQNCINSLNKVWAPVCVKFNLCKTRIDSNYNFYDWNKDTMEAEYIALNYEPRIINIFVVGTMVVPAGRAGYAALNGISNTGEPVIVVVGADPNVWIHEMGHYFGLKHPFEPTLANADNQNCATLDDGICDTPPDPDPSGSSHLSCVYTGLFKDGAGKFYNPLVENFMSYYGSCGKSFTHMQYERMINVYKINPQAKF
jgi:hypothetical protein